MTEKRQFSYDEVPYPSYTFPQTSPDRLATMAAIHGLKAATPAKCRVLELGCGDGANLMSLAYAFPGGDFVGLDLSAVHIDDANSSAATLELANTKFHRMDLMEFDVERCGTFDYIIAHGLYSWVPPAVRQKILSIYSAALRPNGIGYISYNAYPGCHIRRIVSDIMKFHTAGESDPQTVVEMGRTIIGFVTRALSDDSRYKKIFEHEFASLLERNEENLLHDDLSEVNQPFYLHEFVSALQPYGLTYMSDADPVFMGDGSWSPDVSAAVATLGTETIRWEQYLDFLDLTRFRSSLICRTGLTPDRTAAESAIEGLRIASQIDVVTENPALDDESPVAFAGTKGGTFELNHPLTKAALVTARRAWPRSVPYVELLAEANSLAAGDKPADEIDANRTKAFLLQLFKNGFLKLHTSEYEFAAVPGERPEASRFARWQIERGRPAITTLAGTNISPDSDIVRGLILLLDGTRDRKQLAADLPRRVKIPFNERDNFVKGLPEKIENNLTRMAESALLLR